MKREIIMIILAVGLLFGGTAASVAVNPKERIYMTALPADLTGEALKARVLKKAALFNVPTEGRTLQEIAGNVKKEIKVKKESVRNYKTIIRSFSGVFVQYSIS